MAGTPRKLQYDYLKKAKTKPVKPYYVFDERKYAIRIVRLPSNQMPSVDQLNILALYYKEKFPDEIRERLTKFVSDRVRLLDLFNYNKLMRKWNKLIDNAVIYAKIRSFTENKPIYFCQEEMDYILSIDDFDRQYLLFTMCCILKHKIMANNQKSYVIDSKKREFDFTFDDDFLETCSMITGKTKSACSIRIAKFRKDGIITRGYKLDSIDWLKMVDKEDAVFEVVCDDDIIEKFIDYTRDLM